MQVTVTFLWNKKVGGEYVDLFIASAATEEGGGVDAPLFNPSDYRFIKWSTEDYREHVFSSMTVYAQCIPTWETLSFMSPSDLYDYLYNDDNYLRSVATDELLDEVYQELTNGGPRTQGTVGIGAMAESNFSNELSSLTGLSDLVPHNPEFGEYNDEAAANSIINVKNLEIEFKVDKFVDETKTFIQNTVMPYVKHMIPSTAILSYKIKGEESDVITYSPAISLHGNYSPDYTSGGVETRKIRYTFVNVNVWQDEDDKYWLYYTIDNDQLDSEHPVEMSFVSNNCLIVGDDFNIAREFREDDGAFDLIYDGIITIDGHTHHKWLNIEYSQNNPSFMWALTQEPTYSDGEYEFDGLLDTNSSATTYGKWSTNKKIVRTGQEECKIIFYDGHGYEINGEVKPNSGYTGVVISSEYANNLLDVVVKNPFYSWDEEVGGETVTHLVSVNLYVQKNNL